MTDNCKPPLTLVQSKPDLRVVTPMPLYVMAREIANRYGVIGAMIILFDELEGGVTSTRLGTHNLTHTEEREALCDAITISNSRDRNSSPVNVFYEAVVGEEDDTPPDAA